MKVLLTGGGTGGHIYPALALARYIKKKEPDADILFVGTTRGIESRVVPAAGFQLQTITVRGMPRKLSVDLFKASLDLWHGSRQAKKILQEFAPDVVIGTGGYVAGPVVYWSTRRKIPTLLHEQNAIPGITNKIFARRADYVCLSFPGSEKYFPSKTQFKLTGNPRATEIQGYNRRQGAKILGMSPELPLVILVGGSGGAEKLNQLGTELLLQKNKLDYQLLFLTGERYYQWVLNKVEDKAFQPGVDIRPYLNEMPAALAAADIMVTRAGATTLAELTAKGIPAVLIPSPNVTHNHQVINARLLSDRGAAVLLPEQDADGEKLQAEIKKILQNNEVSKKMGEASRQMGIPDAAERFYSLIKTAVNKKYCINR